MEVFYCAMAFTGFAAFFQQGMIKSLIEVFSVGSCFFRSAFLVAKPGPVMEKLEHRMGKLEHRIEEQIEESCIRIPRS